MKKKIIFIISTMMIILLAACSNNENENNNEGVELGDMELDVSEEELVDDDETVAVVNDDEVKGTIYNLVYKQLALHSLQMGQETDEEELKDAAITSVIDRQIVLQEAKKIDIEVTQEDAEEHLNTLKDESEKELETLLNQYQITEEEFVDQIIFELTMNEYVAETIEVDVTDEEVEEEYEKTKAETENKEDVPEFEEIKSQMKKQMLNNKTIEAFQEEIDKIKDGADIEVNM